MDRAVWRARLRAMRARLSANAYRVAEALAEFAHRHTGRCWPSLETISKSAGCSVRTVQRVNAELRDVAGLITWTRRRCRWNRNETNLYQLVLAPPAPASILEKEPLEGSVATVSNGSPPPPPPVVAAALASLGRAMGRPPDEVMPWLRSPAGAPETPIA